MKDTRVSIRDERRECALMVAAAFEGVSFPEIRRQALRDQADMWLENPAIRSAVDDALAYRAKKRPVVAYLRLADER